MRHFRRQAVFLNTQGGEPVRRGCVPLTRRLDRYLLMISGGTIKEIATIEAIAAAARRRRFRLRPARTGFIQVSHEQELAV